MDTFFTKIKANKPTLYLQVLAFLILIGGYHVLYGLVNENQSVVQAFNNYAKNLLLVNTIGAFFTFGAMNYFGFFGKKARTLA